MGNAPSGMLGRYQIIKHLANGGMAQVLLARATGIENFSRHVVVKRIHADRASDPAFVKMFLDEARLAAALHHHNIVQVHDIGQEGGEYFFTMEYVHGEDLRRLLMSISKRKEKVPLEHVITIITAAASALHYAHEQRGPDRKPLGLVHRDVSPANILVGYDGNVKVVDFGIAKAAALRTTETQGGTLKGKVAYMAPEQCAGKPVDRRSDVYALGIVLYELTTVRRLFKGDNDFLTMSAIVQGNIPKPSKHRPDIPAELETIILKALALSPSDRYQSANELRGALDQFAAKHGIRTSNSALGDYMKAIFGEKPEPWLTDDGEPELELTADFDGSASGVAAPPPAAVDSFSIPDVLAPTPSAPIVRARNKAITDNPAASLLNRKPLPALAPSAAKAPLGRPTPPPPRRATPPSVPIVSVAGTGTEASGAVAEPRPAVPRPPVLPTATEIAEATGWGATDKPRTSSATTPHPWPSGTDAKVAEGSAGTSTADISAAVRAADTSTNGPVDDDFAPEPADPVSAAEPIGVSAAEPIGVSAAERVDRAPATDPARRKRLLLIAGGIGAVVLALVLVLALGGGGDEPAPADDTAESAPTTGGSNAAIEPATAAGSADPSAAGSADPTAAGSADPSAADPTAAGSADPSAAGSADPTAAGSADPTAAGSADPTAAGSADPTAAGSADPSAAGAAVKKKKQQRRKATWNPDELFPSN